MATKTGTSSADALAGSGMSVDPSDGNTIGIEQVGLTGAGDGTLAAGDTGDELKLASPGTWFDECAGGG